MPPLLSRSIASKVACFFALHPCASPRPPGAHAGYSSRSFSYTASLTFRAKIKNSEKYRNSKAFPARDGSTFDVFKPCPDASLSAISSTISLTWRPKTEINASGRLPTSKVSVLPGVSEAKWLKLPNNCSTSSVENPSACRYVLRNVTNSSKPSDPLESKSTELSASCNMPFIGMKFNSLKSCFNSVTQISPLLSVSKRSKTTWNCCRSYGMYLSMKL
mmetsp:Transcript_96305/g.277996  ORF Transcript_96305/g.277996 Transcript_96305/m.277996 type:complete len:218 (-) Transcript_96305:1051-1704(-)